MVLFHVRPGDFLEDGVRFQVRVSPLQQPAATGRWLQAVVDTGARKTVLRESLVEALGLPVVDHHVTATAFEAARRVPLVDATLHVTDEVAIDVRAISAPFPGRNLECLLGRDVLSATLLFQDGPGRHASLAF